MIAARFRDNLAALGLAEGDAQLLVALSGGCDSLVLLHLLRFVARVPRLTAAHFDHAMRPSSAADAEWVRGLCRAWRVPVRLERASRPLRSEAQARADRYAYLRRVASEVGASHILTAHHADDQAETVLFRILRGTGLRGLGGIPALSADGLARPLLPFWRTELVGYARAAQLRWRPDPTNRSLGPARNRLRHRILPEIERSVAPRARRSLVRLALLAREAEEGWAALLHDAERDAVSGDGAELVLVRAAFRDYHPAFASRLLRNLLRRLGSSPSRAGTRMALQFITDASSGREFELPGGVRIFTEYERVRLLRASGPADDAPLALAGEGGDGVLKLAGKRYHVAWRVAPEAADRGRGESAWSAAFAYGRIRAPLLLRGWVPGDRIRWRSGSRSLKRLFGDRRLSVRERARSPVLVDGVGEVLWVAGIAQAPQSLPEPGEEALILTITHG